MKIFKYKLKITDTQSVIMPGGSEIISIQYQGNDLCMWAIVDTNEPEVSTVFRIFGTGHDLVDDINHLATVKDPDGFHIWHVFEKI